MKTCSVCGDKKSENIPKLSVPATKNSLGDVNGDNKITAADARVILRTAAKIDTAAESAIAYFDINGDNKITAADARIVLRIAAKLESIDKYIKK